ncbi:Hypothetical protein SMAX5B_008929 [Xyrichtys novacula]|uniref:Ig-like domain-containing protein n=1 Tax=Xyrichtys novacula TaxID=13765 RepID=A0AAV1GPL8_XYRNO|nr:Hypothetical protein SMAX5B_008929 [Xyrichtys novacula]
MRQCLHVLSFFILWTTAPVDGGGSVMQRDSLMKPQGDDATISCKHTMGNQFFYMHWFRLLPGQSLELIVSTSHANKNKPNFFGNFSREKFSTTKPDLENGTFTVKNLEPGDTGSYFCAVGSHSDSDTKTVKQEPESLMKKIGESVISEINCSHRITNYDVILWYKQDKHRGLKLLGYLNNRFPNPEDDVKGKINFDGNGRSDSRLNITNLSLDDSGMYFCAASRHSAADPPGVATKTLLSLSADTRRQHTHEHLQPPQHRENFINRSLFTSSDPNLHFTLSE